MESVIGRLSEMLDFTIVLYLQGKTVTAPKGGRLVSIAFGLIWGIFSELKKLQLFTMAKKSVNSGAFKIPKLLLCVAQRCVHYSEEFNCVMQSLTLISIVVVQNANFI